MPEPVLTSDPLPLMAPGVANAFLIVFIESLADFGNPLLLGGNLENATEQDPNGNGAKTLFGPGAGGVWEGGGVIMERRLAVGFRFSPGRPVPGGARVGVGGEGRMARPGWRTSACGPTGPARPGRSSAG